MSNRNIELGTFTWDSTKLSDQVAANYLELGRLKNVISESTASVKKFQKEISELEKKIEEEHKAQEEFNEMLSEGIITQEEYTEAIEASNAVIEEMIAEQEEAVRSQAELALSITTTQREITELNAEQRELNRLLAAGREEIQGNEGAYKELTTELSAAQQEAKNLGAQLIAMENSGLRESEPERYAELAAAFAEASTRAHDLHDQVLAVDRATGDSRRNVGNYQEAFTSAFSQISQGAQQMMSGNIQEGFDSIKDGFKGIKTAAMDAYAFILANPLTALIAVFVALGAGIYKGVNAMIEYNESIKEAKKLTEDLTGTTGALADQIRIRAQGLTDTFGDDFQEVLKTANTLSKQLGITFEEAFDKIEQGYIRGANANGDFLDRLGEYGPLLNKYGFDLDQIIGLQIQAQEKGLFGDKFEDSIKEAGLSLEEFTKAQSDALTSAFGKTFSDKISKDVNSGVITVKDALILMSAEAKKRGLSVQEFGILTADVFKGAGEDIGGAKVMFSNIYEGINNLDKPLTAIQEKTLKLSEANYELGKAKDDALKSDKLMAFMSDLDFFMIKAETLWYNFIAGVTDAISWLDNITGSSEILNETWEAATEYAESLWSAIEEIFDAFSNLATALGLNNSESQSFLKNVLKMINPLNLLKGIYQALTTAVKTFGSMVTNTGLTLSTFAISAKSIFKQLAEAAALFMNADLKGGLEKLKSIDLGKEFATARKEAERIYALNKANKDKKVVEVAPEKESTTNKGGLTQAEKDALAKAAEEARKKAEAEAKKAENKRIADAKKAAEEAKKALEEEAKRTIEIAKQEAEQKSDIAKTELAEYIANNAEKLKNDKSLLKSKLNEQLAYYDEVKRLRQQELNAEEVAKILSIQQKIDEIDKKKELGKQLNDNDLNERKLLLAEIDNVHKEYYNKEVELNNETNEKKKELNKKYEEDLQEQRDLKQALSFQKRIIDLESQHAIESEIQRVQLDSDTQQRLDAFLKENELKRLLDQENYDTNQEIIAQRTELENQLALLNDENEKLRIQNKLNELNVIQADYVNKQKQIDKLLTDSKLDGFATVFSAAKNVLGEQTAVGKAAAIAETTINTYKAAQAAYTSLAGIPIVGPALGAVAAGLAVVQGLANVRKIVAVKGYAGGGLINDGVEISRSNGDNRLITAKDGEVILNETQQAMLGGSSTFRSIGVPGFANGGIVGSSLASVQKNFKTETPVINLDQNSVNQLRDAIYSGSQEGFSDLSENRRIANGSNF